MSSDGLLSRRSSSDSLAIATLAARSQLEDIQALKAGWKGKARDDSPLTDAQHAVLLTEQLLEVQLQEIEDKKLAISLGRACQLMDAADALCFEEKEDDDPEGERWWNSRRVELLSEYEGATPSSLAGFGSNEVSIASTDIPTCSTPSDQQSLPVVDEADEADEAIDDLHLPNLGQAKGTVPLSKIVQCVACQDKVSLATGAIQVPCDHHYCNECIIELFKSAITDETLMPPRCCRIEIPHRFIRRLWPAKEYTHFLLKSVEFATTNRLYCPRASCSAFIGEASKEKGIIARCPDPTCGVEVCAYCKTEKHPVSELCSDEKDEASKLALELGEREGWRRCKECRRLIQLGQGCFHITCICRNEFCYLCGATWKTCDCRQWDEDRLLDAAEERVQAENPRRHARRLFGELVQAAVDDLRVNHDCRHLDGFDYSSGGGRCVWCNFRLPSYLFRCGGCSIRVCNRCRRNRIY